MKKILLISALLMSQMAFAAKDSATVPSPENNQAVAAAENASADTTKPFFESCDTVYIKKAMEATDKMVAAGQNLVEYANKAATAADSAAAKQDQKKAKQTASAASAAADSVKKILSDVDSAIANTEQYAELKTVVDEIKKAKEKGNKVVEKAKETSTKKNGKPEAKDAAKATRDATESVEKAVNEAKGKAEEIKKAANAALEKASAAARKMNKEQNSEASSAAAATEGPSKLDKTILLIALGSSLVVIIVLVLLLIRSSNKSSARRPVAYQVKNPQVPANGNAKPQVPAEDSANRKLLNELSEEKKKFQKLLEEKSATENELIETRNRCNSTANKCREAENRSEQLLQEVNKAQKQYEDLQSSLKETIEKERTQVTQEYQGQITEYKTQLSKAASILNSYKQSFVNQLRKEFDALAPLIESTYNQTNNYDENSGAAQMSYYLFNGFKKAREYFESLCNQSNLHLPNMKALLVEDATTNWLSLHGWVNYSSMLNAYCHIPNISNFTKNRFEENPSSPLPDISAALEDSCIDSTTIALIQAHVNNILGALDITLLVPNVLVDKFEESHHEPAEKPTSRLKQVSKDTISPRDCVNVIEDFRQVGYIMGNSEQKITVVGG